MKLKAYTITVLGALLIICLVHVVALAQVYSDKVVGKKNAELIDSIKTTEYPYALPIWGKKAASLGFNLPYSAGIGMD